MKRITFIGLLLLFVGMAMSASEKDGKPSFKSVYNTLPSGYERLADTDVYYRYRLPGSAFYSQCGVIDVMGLFNNKYYSSTYNEGGYQAAFQVDNNNADFLDCMNGTTKYGVTATARIESFRNFGRIVYTFTNNNDYDVTISAGVYADVKIGDKDNAPLSRIADAAGNTYGLLLKDAVTGATAALNVYFGDGIPGVDACDGYWFGKWTSNTNNSASAVVGNYTQSSNWMEEDGSYDSAMGFCWKNRTIAAGETIELSFMLGIGDLQKQSAIANVNVYYENLPDWNYIGTENEGGMNHEFTVEATFLSDLSATGRLYFQADDDTEWTCANENNPFAANSAFSQTLNTMFRYAGPTHELRLMVVGENEDTVMIDPITWIDIKNHVVTDGLPASVTYEDEPVVFDMSGLCDLLEGQYTVSYMNNDAPGMATMIIEGVYAPGSELRTHIPYQADGTVGRVVYMFEILSSATGINEVNTDNGENVYYNMQGVRVANPTNGIFIKNGKKVILK